MPGVKFHRTARRASIAGVPLFRPIIERLRQTEVEHVHDAVAARLDVRRLQVAMNDAILMVGFERFGSVLRNRQRLVHGNGTTHHTVGQRRSFDDFSATSRPNLLSRARYTSPIPPALGGADLIQPDGGDH
jgi:hypothetical protein